MTRRLALALTTLAVLGTGVGVASASTTHVRATPSYTSQHQFCVLLYRSDNPTPQHICLNW